MKHGKDTPACSAWAGGPKVYRPCGQPATAHEAYRIIDLCSEHAVEARSLFTSGRDEVIDSLIAEGQAYRQAVAQVVAPLADLAGLVPRASRKAPDAKAQQVYFIRCEGFVKIGISADPQKRLETIQRSGNGTLAPPINLAGSHIAATESGGRGRERELHRKFARLRVVGEWFKEDDELRSYIDSLPAVFPSLAGEAAA